VSRPSALGLCYLTLEQARAYRAGDKFYVEVDVIMDKDERLQVTHDVAESLQRKLEGTSKEQCASKTQIDV
jgi:glycerophosphoryl diester phosphodiesterase